MARGSQKLSQMEPEVPSSQRFWSAPDMSSYGLPTPQNTSHTRPEDWSRLLDVPIAHDSPCSALLCTSWGKWGWLPGTPRFSCLAGTGQTLHLFTVSAIQASLHRSKSFTWMTLPGRHAKNCSLSTFCTSFHNCVCAGQVPQPFGFSTTFSCRYSLHCAAQLGYLASGIG